MWSPPWRLRHCTLPSCWDWRSTREPWTLGPMQVRALCGMAWAARRLRSSWEAWNRDREGRRGRSSLCPGSLTWLPASVWPHFPIRPGFLASETKSDKALLGPLSLVPLLPGVLVPGPQSVCAGSGHPPQVVSQALVSCPPWAGDGGGGSPTPAAFSQPFSDLDFVMLDDSLHVRATYISGELVWQAEEAQQ